MTIPAAPGGQAQLKAVPAAMDWDGAVNAWHVAGDVYRMGRREWLTEGGWRQAYHRGIRTVVDLRNAAEIRRRETDPTVPETATAGFDVVLAPTEDPDNREFRELCVPYLSDPVSYADNARLFPDLLAGVFKAVAAAKGGVVIHCSAGRDRSGMIAAMLQDLAGHSDEAIVRGYQRSVRGINEHHRLSTVPHPHERFLPEDVLMPLLESRGKSLLEFVRSLNTADYLNRHGVTHGELAAILAKLGR
jgi:protein-tyrosine phosphatase